MRASIGKWPLAEDLFDNSFYVLSLIRLISLKIHEHAVTVAFHKISDDLTAF